MKRFSGKLLAIVVAFAVLAMAAQLAVAQNEGRRSRDGRGRGPGGPGGPGGFGGMASIARLATIEKVQEVLKLTDDQKTKIEKINTDFFKEMREAFDGDRPSPEKMRKLREEQNDKLKEVLDADQQKRLTGVFVQLMGAAAVMDPVVGKEIGLTDEQRDQLRKALGPPAEGRPGREGRGSGQSMQERRENREKEILAILTPEQQKKLEELKGEKVDIDLSALRSGGGREGRGRERGERGGRRGGSREESKAGASQ